MRIRKIGQRYIPDPIPLFEEEKGKYFIKATRDEYYDENIGQAIVEFTFSFSLDLEGKDKSISRIMIPFTMDIPHE